MPPEAPLVLAKKPDITPVQMAAGLKFVVMVLLALGLDISSADQVTIIGASGLLCAVFVTADALIRRGRAKALSTIAAPPSNLDPATLKQIVDALSNVKPPPAPADTPDATVQPLAATPASQPSV